MSIRLWMVMILAAPVLANAQIVISSLSGTAFVRHGVQEEWLPLAVADTIRRDDAIRTDPSARCVVALGSEKSVVIPHNVIIEISDLRVLSQEDLLLQLAMKDVRALPRQSGETTPELSRTTTVHGTDQNHTADLQPLRDSLTTLQLEGTRVLFDNKYYATCVLRVREVFLINPALRSQVQARVRAAEALEYMNLRSEALSEYRQISALDLTAAQRVTVNRKVNDLAKKQGE